MTRERIIGATTLLLAVIAVTAWAIFVRPAESSRPGASQLAIELRGPARGSMMLAAQLHWCPVTRSGVLEAVRGDTGVVVVFYENDSLTPVPHVVVMPQGAGAATRPAASMVMRWVRGGRDTALAMFRSESGTVRLQITGTTASGDLNARLRSATSSDSLLVTGAFRGVPISATAVGCG